MENTKQFNDLRLRINNFRRKGDIKAFPTDLKTDVLGLVKTCGMSRVAREVGLSTGLLHIWKKKFTDLQLQQPEQELDLNKINFHITRVISENKKQQEILPVASVIKGELEIRFFDISLASAICEKVLL